MHSFAHTDPAPGTAAQDSRDASEDDRFSAGAPFFCLCKINKPVCIIPLCTQILLQERQRKMAEIRRKMTDSQQAHQSFASAKEKDRELVRKHEELNAKVSLLVD
jgi:hypothetical protein